MKVSLVCLVCISTVLLLVKANSCSGSPIQIQFEENGNVIRPFGIFNDNKKDMNYVNLKHLLDKFMALIDMDELAEFITEKLATDPDAQAVYEYLFEQDAKTIVEFLWSQESYAELIEWFYYNGLTNIYNELNELHTFFGWTTVQVPDKNMPKTKAIIPASLGSLLEEFLNELPLNLISALAYELLQNNDPAFMAVINKLKSSDIGNLWSEFKALPEVENLKETLEEGGVNLEIFIALLEAFFGWGRLSFY